MDFELRAHQGQHARRHLPWVFAMVLFWILTAAPAFAFCNTYQVDKTPGPSEESVFCRSSFPGLSYQVSQHFFVDGFATSLIFSPRTRNILCHEYEIADYLYSSCKGHGLRSPFGTFQSGAHQIEVTNLARMSNRELRRLFDETLVFRSTEYAEEAQIDRCLVVMTEVGEVSIAFLEDDPMPLASCLIRFETFLTANRHLVRD